MSEVAPKVRVHAVPNTVLEIPDQLEHNHVDCVLSVFVNESHHPDQVRSRSLWEVEYACLMRRGHPLASMKRLSPRRFLAARHVDVSPAGKTATPYSVPGRTRVVAKPGRYGQPLQRGV